MTGQDLVPWFALAVGAMSLGWHILDARRRRATRVALTVQHAALPASIPNDELLDVPGIGIDDRSVIWPARDEPLTYVIVLSAVNYGESQEWLHDMRIHDLGATIGDGASPPGGPPFELSARGRKSWAFRVDDASFDLGEGFFVEIILGSKAIRSGSFSLNPEIEEHILNHNSQL